MTNYTLFDALLEPVFILNKNQEIVYCNETAAIVADATVRKLTRGGKKLTDFITFAEPLDGLNQLTTVRESTPYKEVNFENHSGQAGKVQITFQLIHDDPNDPHWITFVRDVTLEERLQKKYRGELEQKEDVIVQLQKAQVELQNYSKNLEKMVEERTQEISSLNRTMTALLDSLKQGFFLFDAQGVCLPVSSKACHTVLEMDPKGKNIWDVFKIPENKVESFQKWMKTIFGEMLPFEDLAPLGPAHFPHTQGLKVQLDYFPLRDEEQKLKAIVVVATDITDLVQAQKEAEMEKARVQKILSVVQNKKQLRTFFMESEEWLQVLKKEVQKEVVLWDIELTKRALHTIKGNASLYSLLDVSNVAHLTESFLVEQPPEKWPKELSVAITELENGLQDFKEEVQTIMGEQALASDRRIELPQSELQKITDILRLWSKGQLLAESIHRKYFCESLHSFFTPFNEIMKKTASSLGKEILPLQVQGADLDVLPQNVSTFFSVLVHCFRNSVDHGIEDPSTREAAGKNRAGLITVTTEFVNKEAQNFLQIVIQDDGGGINPEKVKNKLLAKGISCENETPQQLIQHIFDPSFSTKEQVTEISGRGVGLDAVKSAVLDLSGQIYVESEMDKGSRFIFLFPVQVLTQKRSTESQEPSQARNQKAAA